MNMVIFFEYFFTFERTLEEILIRIEIFERTLEFFQV